MQDFEIKDSSKNDKTGVFEFYLAFLKVHCSKDGILYQRKYPYEQYEDFYTHHSHIFNGCNSDLKRIIDTKDRNELTDSDFQIVLDEFEKRCFTRRTGQRENWYISFSGFALFFRMVFIVASIICKSFFLVAVGVVFSAACFSSLLRNINVGRVISGKQKNPKTRIFYFPVRTNEVFKKLDQLWRELKEDVIQVDSEDIKIEDLKILEELVQEGQLLKEDGKYKLAGPIKSFVKWREEQGDIYDIKNNFICKNILQTDGSKITLNSIYQAKSRNKEDEKPFLD